MHHSVSTVSHRSIVPWVVSIAMLIEKVPSPPCSSLRLSPPAPISRGCNPILDSVQLVQNRRHKGLVVFVVRGIKASVEPGILAALQVPCQYFWPMKRSRPGPQNLQIQTSNGPVGPVRELKLRGMVTNYGAVVANLLV
ncbi:hypothetical protein INR49_024409 [Caranx melampygus]|nr:hypothetical protein INR49_024409 [Caranx melampygus]